MVRSRDDSPKRRARKCLTVGAVADRSLFRIDLGFIGDVTAVTPSIDLHDPILHRLSFRLKSGDTRNVGFSLNDQNRKLPSAKWGATVNLRCRNADPLMSESGQNPNLPHRNTDGRFTSISRPQQGGFNATLVP